MDPTLCENGICVNTDGGFRCECQDGFKIDPTGTNCVGRFIKLFYQKSINIVLHI